MALFKGKLFAGALFAGALFGAVPDEVVAGAGQRDREKELWQNLPDIVQWKPKETVEEVVFIPPVFLPARENVSPEEVASIAKEVARKIKTASIVIDSEEDDEEALFLLGIL